MFVEQRPIWHRKVKTASGFHWWLSSCGITQISQDWDLCGSEIKVLLGDDLDKEQGSSQKLTFPHSHYEKKKPTKQKITSVGEDVKELEPRALTVRMSHGPATLENSIAVPQKIKNRITIWSSNSPSGLYPKESKAERLRHICVLVFIEALCTIPKGGSNPSVHQWMNA